MRCRWLCAQMTILCLLLAACAGGGGGSAAEEAALQIRTEYLAMGSCTASVELTADYGQRVYTYAVDLSWTRDADTLMTVTAPESVAGTAVRISKGETWLEYDGAAIETGPLSPEGLSPVDAVPALLTAAQEAYMAECVEETLGERAAVRVSCREADAPAGVGTEIELWFDKETHALLRGEISVDGFTVIQCAFTNFTFG